METIENAIKLASSQLTHSILPISCPKNKEYDDILALIHTSNVSIQNNLENNETDHQ